MVLLTHFVSQYELVLSFEGILFLLEPIKMVDILTLNMTTTPLAGPQPLSFLAWYWRGESM